MDDKYEILLSGILVELHHMNEKLDDVHSQLSDINGRGIDNIDNLVRSIDVNMSQISGNGCWTIKDVWDKLCEIDMTITMHD